MDDLAFGQIKADVSDEPSVWPWIFAKEDDITYLELILWYDLEIEIHPICPRNKSDAQGFAIDIADKVAAADALAVSTSEEVRCA